MTDGIDKPSALPSPLRGGAEGAGRAATTTRTRRAVAWEREASELSVSHTRALASSLRRRLTPSHFRRQVAIGPFVVDFCCRACRLVLEVNGNQHGFDVNLERDAARTHDLEALGFRVLRFSNRDVMTSMEVVLDTILAAASPTPPTPSPQGGGERVEFRT